MSNIEYPMPNIKVKPATGGNRLKRGFKRV